MIRPLGHLPDPSGLGRGRELGHLLGARTAPPREWYLDEHLPPVLDQRGSSCVGAAFRSALMIAASVGGWHLEPSYLAIYALARQLHSPTADELIDLGSHPHRAIEALEDWGVVGAHRWGDDARLTSPVPIDVLEAGSVARVTGVYRIEETGAARLDAIRSAIAAGHPVFFGMSVDDAYMAWPGLRVYMGRTGTDRGGHAQVLTGYAVNSFHVLNSWGYGWGAQGRAQLSPEWIADGDVYDFTVITTAPREVR